MPAPGYVIPAPGYVIPAKAGIAQPSHQQKTRGQEKGHAFLDILSSKQSSQPNQGPIISAKLFRALFRRDFTVPRFV
jgi:hypothetical protein